MKKLRKILYWLLYLIAVLLAAATILSIFRNSEIRYLKMLDFPRIQLFVFSFISLLVLVLITKKWQWYTYLVSFALLCGLAINGAFIINYTTLVPVEVPTATDLKAADVQFSLLVSNVKMSNKNAQPLIDLIAEKKPDLVLAMEVNEWWDEELSVINKEYPYSQHTINEVTYGMVLYSKLPLNNVEVAYLNNKNVPSFECVVTLSNGKDINFHCMHPVPPTHFEDLPDNKGQKETALQKLGKIVNDSKIPSVVAGDLNDVVWSYVNDLTNTQNILYDLRVGRGFYNTYNAENLLMKWPLDHVFVTKEFRLKKLERLPKIGSDHYPIYVELVL
ncbi:endonuclease/exonuclease/phosphatase family protein [Aequorivita sp. CIP111184]|uniref:endonuclease/exonuclease/phosphatase family protein n=1 Tax=Aequorivita sp. CIP111184 TaxID=2211356 RepID=UPI000DBC25EB|nr:endonuclease/exonuclease/phosphatase family protein [Aequorivita sp. CIP111184]SRX54815.1 hypothetical protein AEQU1_01833 [Aequorivita sp. CIP111184]